MPESHRESTWLLVRFLREAARGFAQGWREVPAHRRMGWFLVILLGGVVLTNLLMAGLSIKGQDMADAGKFAWEEQFLRNIEQRLSLSFYKSTELGIPGSSMVLWPLMIISALVAARARRPFTALSFPVGYALVSMTVFIGWELWHRERPTLIMGGIGSPGFHSFPSGHTAHTIVAYGFLLYLAMLVSRSAVEKVLMTLLMIVLTGVIIVARLRLGTHWPTDIVAGGVIGFAWLAVIIGAHRLVKSA